MEFGKRIKQLRKQKGLTLRALAEKVGLDFTYISKVENGRVDYTPSTNKIRNLAQVLGVDGLELLNLANKVPPELEPIANNASARAFLRRAQTLSTKEDWDDLLRYLDRQQSQHPKRKKGGAF
jgi:transcriptional regulator with XRE-family HTH domain